MRIHGKWLATTAILTLGFAFPQSAALHAQGAVALSGQVSSPEEGVMEGVLVSARKSGASFTVTVVSDEKGHYAFPAARLEPGHYTLTIRAGGYEPSGALAADVAADKPATADIGLQKIANPKKRTLLRVVLLTDDREETAGSVERLMGTKAEARFAFIQERAEFADTEELDI